MEYDGESFQDFSWFPDFLGHRKSYADLPHFEQKYHKKLSSDPKFQGFFEKLTLMPEWSYTNLVLSLGFSFSSWHPGKDT